MRYEGGVDVAGLIAKANAELAADVEPYKAFLLALFAGLRRGEIDKLRWQSIDFRDCLVKIKVQPDFSPKAETSVGEVPIEPQVAKVLQALREAEPDAIYVMAGAPSKVGASWCDYRAAGSFERLTAWLRLNGLDSQKPLHQLRKEAGSLVCKSAGLFAASRFLRHADTQITARHYVETRNITTVGLGAFLAPQKPAKRKGKAKA
jgi:integrase